jgi:hypothetical protein
MKDPGTTPGGSIIYRDPGTGGHSLRRVSFYFIR